MSRRRWLQPAAISGMALLCWLLALLIPEQSPDHLGTLTWLRGGVGVLTLLLAPGWLLAPRIFGRELRGQPLLQLLGSIPLAMPIAFANLVLLRLVGHATEARVAGLLLLETLAIAAWWWRSPPAPIEPEPETGPAGTRDRRLWLGLGAGLLLFIALLAQQRPMAWRDPTLLPVEQELEALLSRAPRQGAQVRYETAGWSPLTAFRSDQGAPFRLHNDTAEPQQVQVAMLVHCRSPFSVDVVLGGRAIDQSRYTPSDRWSSLATRWSTLAAGGNVTVPPAATVEGRVQARSSTPCSYRDLTGISVFEVQSLLAARGTPMIPAGAMNHTVEVRSYARAVGRADTEPFLFPDNLTAPPGYTYLAGSLLRLGPDHGVSYALLVAGLLLCLVAAGALSLQRTAGSLQRPLDPLLIVGLAVALARFYDMTAYSQELTYPDATYAIAIAIAAVLGLAAGPRLFTAWAMVTTNARYPGATVCFIALGAWWLVDRRRRAEAVRTGLHFGVVLGIFCAAMFLTGLVTGELGSWFRAMGHETWAEHFEQNPHVPLLDRAHMFCRGWLVWGGGGLLFALPARKPAPRVFVLTLLAYAPLVMFIDHYSPHYLMPLLVLAPLAAAHNLAAVKQRWLRWPLALVWGLLCYPPAELARWYESL